MKVLFGILLVLSIAFFAFMQWGGQLTGAAKNGQGMADLHAEKIKLLVKPETKMTPASAVLPAAAALPPSASAVIPASAPGIVAASAPAAVAVPVHTVIPAPAPVPALKAAPVSCMEWGEFSGTDLKQATQALAAMKLGNRLSQRAVEYVSGYWVYIPPLKNHAAVNKKIAQLKALGVEEYFVVQMPSHKVGAISLGVFKTGDAARKYLAAVKKKGVRGAKIGERKSKLKFTVFAIKQVDAETAAHLKKLQKDISNSELREVSCN